MFAELEENSESGAVLIIAVIIMAVSVTFIAAMNNIIAPMLHSEQEQEIELQLEYLAEAGLARRLQEVEAGTISLGESEWEEFGPGEYKTDVNIADGDYVYLSSTARIEDKTETVSTKRELNKEELYHEDFSEVRPAINLAGEGYTETDYGNESQISDEFTIEAWVKLDDTDIDDDKYIFSGYNEIINPVGDFSYSKPYSLYFAEGQGNRINLIAEVETWIDNWWPRSDEREYLSIELGDVEELIGEQWAHIAFSGQGPTRQNNLNNVELDLYVDGVEQESEVIPVGGYQYLHTNYQDDIDKNIALGAGFDDGGWIMDNYLPGQIRDIRIWDEVRSKEEINDNKDSYLSGEEDGLVTYYPVNDPPDESITDGISDHAADNHASKEGEVTYSLTENWINTGISSLDNLMVEVDDEILAVNDLFWFYDDQSFDYDEDSLYKIDFQIKQADSSDEGTDYFYLGVEGLGGGGKLVDASGDRGHSEQYYTALMGEEIASDDGWQSFSGYFSGGARNSDEVYTTIDNNPASAIIHNPMPLHSQVQDFRPVIVANYDWDESDDFGTAKIDYIKIKELEIDTGR